MTMSVTAVRRGLFGAFATCALGSVAAATIAIPSAGAQPGCTASDFSHMASGVLDTAGGWLDAHPEANDVLTSAGMQGAGAETSVRDYFVAHPQEYQELRGIAAPLMTCSTAAEPRSSRCRSPRCIRRCPSQARRCNGYIRPWRLRTKLYAPKAAIPRAATMSRTLPNGA